MTYFPKHLEVLIIEDNLGDFTLVKEYLEECFEKIVIHHALNFKATESFLESDINFDIIFLDLTLPDEFGKTLIKKTIDLAKQTPVIILTGFLNLNFCVESLELGVSDYLFKDEINSNSLFKSVNYTIQKQKQRLDIIASEKKYSDLFHFSPVAMFVFESQTLRFLDANTAAIRLFGYTAEEFLEMNVEQIIITNDSKSSTQHLKDLKQKESYTFENHFLYRNKSGGVIKAEVILKKVELDDHKARLVVIKDVTERYRYVETLKIQNERLKQIAWQQSHEMRSPVSKVLGMIDLLNADVCTPNENKILLQEIEISVKEIDKLIRSISNKAVQIQPKN